jgi:hypothetical protein
MMMMNFLRLCSLALLCLSSAFAWIGNHQSVSSRPSTQLFGVETISLQSLVNHEEDGTRMAESIAKWLDSEVRLTSIMDRSSFYVQYIAARFAHTVYASTFILM